MFVPYVLPISQKENGPIMIPKTVRNQDSEVASNLAVEIAVYNFDLFHCTPMLNSGNFTLNLLLGKPLFEMCWFTWALPK